MKKNLDRKLPDLPIDSTSQLHIKTIARSLFNISCIPELSDLSQTLTLPRSIKDLYSKTLRSNQQYLQYKINQLKKLGRHPTCKSGCAFCCHFMPSGVSSLEVLFIYDSVHENRNFPRIFRRFLERQEIMEEISANFRKNTPLSEKEKRNVSEEILLRYRAKHIPCPFLSEDNVCTQYTVRPFVCREYFSFSPGAWCDLSHPHYSQALRIALPLPYECRKLLDKIDTTLGLKLPETLSEAFLVFSINIARFKPIIWK